MKHMALHTMTDRLLLGIGFLALAIVAGFLVSLVSRDDSAGAFELMGHVEGDTTRPAVAVVLQLADCPELLGQLAELSDHHTKGELNVTGFVVDAVDDSQIAGALGPTSISFPLRPAQELSIVRAVRDIGYRNTPMILIFDEMGRLRLASPWGDGALPDRLGPLEITLSLRTGPEPNEVGLDP